MFLQINENIDLLYFDALKYFPLEYVKNFNSKESIVSRYLISINIKKIYWIVWFMPKVDQNWIPLFNNGIFWSISHKENLVYIWIDNKNIWVDIEIYKKRDKSVLNQFCDYEYDILWWKNWINFYILWTAKESIIKFILWNLDSIKSIKLQKFLDCNISIWNLHFSKELILNNNWDLFQVFFNKNDSFFYSLCCKKI